MTDRPSAPVQRLDKWLWYARVVKSRTLAAQLVGSGKVRVNRVRVVKPSHALREGDILTIALRGKVRVLQVLAPGVRRGPPQEARLLYRPIGENDRSEPLPSADRPRPAPGDGKPG
jgi:ribosome-associated heat shock protein Hsp15